MARYYFGDGSAIGKRFTFEGQSGTYEIVGVAGDAKDRTFAKLRPGDLPPRVPGSTRQVLAICDADRLAPARIVDQVRAVVRDTLKTVPVAKVTTLAEQVDESIAQERLMASLASGFGGLGAVLAALGLYGLLAYTVARRTTEIGIRMALGATRRDVTRMVLNNALRLVCAGVVLGAPIAFWSERFAANLIVNLRVEPVFPVAVAAAAMIVVALVAAYVPARRAARVHPMDALRHS